MAVTMASRMASRPALSSVCSSCRHRLLRQQQTRSASSSSSKSSSPSDSDPFASLIDSMAKPSSSSTPPKAPRKPIQPQSIFQQVNQKRTPGATDSSSGSRSAQASLESLLTSANAEASTRPGAGVPHNEPYHLHISATKHNTHITFTEPSRSPIISYSCGQIGLRKAQRGSFDAAYQLATYTMRKMAMHQWRVGGAKLTKNQMKTLRDVGTKDTGVGIEVIMRGYGPGREAFQKALLGTEGAMIKPLIVRVSDATRLKFGGTRSPAVRRLG